MSDSRRSALTHEQLCERARRWLSGTRRCDPVFSNIASCREIPDAIGWSSCWKWHGSTVVEAKTSQSDFYADKKKYSLWKPKSGPDSDAGTHGSIEWRFFRYHLTIAEAERMGYELIDLPRMGDFRFFMCEPDIITPPMVEQHAPDHGLLYVEGRSVRVVRPAPRRETLVDKDGEIRYLRFAIINQKQKFDSGDALPCCQMAVAREPATEGSHV